MAIADERKRIGRKPFKIVEADLDFCVNEMSDGYSSGVCTAVPDGNLLLQSSTLSATWSGTATVTDNAANYNGVAVADKIDDVSVVASQTLSQSISFDPSQVCAAWMRFKRDSTPRTTRFGALRLQFSGSSTENYYIYFDTSTGEWSISGAADGIVVNDPIDADYMIAGIYATSVDPANTVATVTISPAVGASASWVTSVTTTGSIYAVGLQVVQGTTRVPILTDTTTAAISATCMDACYKTRKTCKDVLSYSSTAKTYKFCENVAGIPVGLGAFPCVSKISTLPTRITPGKGLGYKASVTIEMSDFPYHDRGIDPYVITRTYTPENQGTFFGKLMARNPYYKGRTIRVLSGYIAEDGSYSATNFQTHQFVIDSMEFDHSKGRFIIKASDVLSKASDGKAQAPIISTGSLLSDITSGSTSLTLQSGEGADYNDPAVTLANEYIRIGDEIIQYTGISTDTLTGLTRASWDSVADAHSADDSVQQCLAYESVNCVDVVSDLLQTYSGVSASLIPTTDWNAEKAGNLSAFIVNAIITKPEDVDKLIGELSEQSLFSVWWDERAQEIKLKSIAPYTTDTSIDDTANITAINIKKVDADRISRLIVYYDLRDRVNPDKEESYRSVYANVDLESEGATKYGEPRIKVVKSRWYSSGGPVAQYASRMQKWKSETPTEATISVDAKDGSLWVADPIDVTSSTMQDEFGNQFAAEMMIIEAKEEKDGMFKYIAINAPFYGRYAKIMANGSPDYSAATEAQKAAGGWIAASSSGFTDGGEAYKIA